MENKFIKDIIKRAPTIIGAIAVILSMFVFIIKTNNIGYMTLALGVLGAAVGAASAYIYAKVRSVLHAPRVFISYAAEDIEAVNMICKSIKHLPIKILIDRNELNVGDNINKKLSELVDSSDYFVYVSSSNSSKSMWAEKELRKAIQENKKILPVVLDDNEVPKPITDLVYADFRISFESGIDQLVKVFKNSRDKKAMKVDVK